MVKLNKNVKLFDITYTRTYHLYEYIIEIQNRVNSDEPIIITFINSENLNKSPDAFELALNTFEELTTIIEDFKEHFEIIKNNYKKN